MKKIKLMYLSILGLVLAGCVMTPMKNANDVFMQSKVSDDPYEKTTRIYAPLFYDALPIGFAYLRAQVKNNKIVYYQIYVNDRDVDWKFIQGAYDIDGNKLDFYAVDRKVTGAGSIEENYVITVDRKYLNNSIGKGINFKAIGQRGSTIVRIPSFYIEGFLKKVDEYRS